MEKKPPDIYAHLGLVLGAFVLVKPNPQISVVIGCLLIFFSSAWLICNLEWNWINRWWRKTLGVVLLLALSGFIGFSSWPKKEPPEIVLKVDYIPLPVSWEKGPIQAIEIMGRFVSPLGKGFRSADKLPGFWPKKDMEGFSEAREYTITNRGTRTVYNMLLDFKIIHGEAVPIGSGFGTGEVVFEAISPIRVSELTPGESFAFYVRNLSEDFIWIEPPEFATFDGEQKIKIKNLGRKKDFPLNPSKIGEKLN